MNRISSKKDKLCTILGKKTFLIEEDCVRTYSVNTKMSNETYLFSL